jgi:hypothetical protein
MKGITVCCDDETSLEKALSQIKSKKIKSSKKISVLSLISKLFTARQELKLVNERG